MITKIIASNRRARYDYQVLDTYEAGIMLLGTEVKSSRLHSVSIREAHIAEMQTSGELYLFNANIPEYKASRVVNHEPKRPRKLLLHKNQLSKLIGQVKKKGMTIVPLEMYANEKGIIKISIALAKGKTEVDKRETIKEREWQKQKKRELVGDNH